ncbi:type I methionyl aminopeptidase [Candidatus Campbellbacteria bacterium CG10_big_fil_rev_8_21_14_0_10_35_52]|uniref:Methionine aminopeptidase n=1 Tax=Candidatus Campbellbacteria bacterium CG10_big_fil_rev_8_21_14_0_10_35_52 TaxID=1974527 RepID=A0A2M6WVR7_9BACT|nr:MAG: type I methionyl aminopeptidase [Candidatus Campbellbacteria bacterium CG10_big_fil_rev_8_21_14_0_10_35_52]
MIKTKKEIEIMREGGKRLAEILQKVSNEARAELNASVLNALAEKLIRAGGDEPAFLNYRPEGASRPYPAVLCVSINNEIVHGIPNEETKILHEGDIVGLDLGLKHKRLFLDMAITVPIGKISKEYQKLINTTKEALEVGIKAANGGNRVGDIGYAIEQFVKKRGYSMPYELGGHGIGSKPAEKPYIPNRGRKNTGEKLKAGMVLALEPMLNKGDADIMLMDDGYTYKTANNSRSAHFEHTILITNGDAEVLTKNIL